MSYEIDMLKGRDVVLRPLSPADAAALAEAAAESREHYRFNPVPDGVEQARDYVATALRQRDKGERIPFVVLFHGQLVGTTSYACLETWRWPAGSALQREGRPDVVEVGYTWLAHSAQRTRCNTEAKFLLLQHAFEAWEVHRVSLRTDERNERSRRAIERLGARFEGIRRADKPAVDGGVRDSAFYSIVRAEWPAVRDVLLQRLGAAAC